ncbi:MAG TPA: tetratricopeptide repeat protein [Acidimicrobiales bacterium]|nr:tetratricopeptide repeat protein [Acidimicrobiales bacterium]
MGLPAGVVTFLFTDIQGSTRLFREFGDEYPKLLDAHNEVIRKAVAENNGHEVSTEGDAFFLAFASPHDALRAAVDAQRRLAAYGWPEGGVIQVRMGLHTGDAHPTGDNYIALAVHQAARVAASGHGGQIVVSSATAELCTSVPEITLEPLGAHMLKDFPSVEALYQVAGDGLDDGFPPLRTPTATSNLPRPRTQFLGRRAELQQLADLTERASLVTLTGTGGTGKTRLSIELARRVADRFENGVVWVDLAARTDPDLVPQAIAEALGIGEQPSRVLVHTIVDHLCLTRTLVVIDNCEHLVEATANVVEHLLDGCERIVVVATSREPLGVDGERVFRVPSLATDADADGDSPAVALFIDRAEKANAAFATDPAALEAVRSICARLDGIPLAIELAASRLRSMSLQDLATRLEDRFALLSGGARTALPRQQTLRGLVDWSYELLDEDERSVFRRISVFNGRFPLEGAEALCADLENDAFSVMSRLVDKSLVNMHDTELGTRFQLLQTIRHYGFDRLLDAGEATEARSRHRDWCASAIGKLPKDLAPSSSEYRATRLALDELIEDVRASFEWCAAAHTPQTASGLLGSTFWYFLDTGLFGEARRRAEALLADTAPEDPAVGWLFALLYSAAWEQGDYAAAERYLRALLALSDEVLAVHDVSRAEALNDLGASLWRLGRLDEAEVAFRDCIALRGDGGPTALQRHNIGLVQLTRGDFAAARAAFHDALLACDHDDPMTQACVMRLGMVAIAQGDWAEAHARLDEAAAMFSPRGPHVLLSHYRGDLALAEGRFDDAEAAYAATAATYVLHANTNGAAHERLCMARVSLARGDFDRARQRTEEALATFEQQGDLSKIARAHADLAGICAARGDTDAAFDRWHTALESARHADEQIRVGEFLIELANAALAVGDYRAEFAALNEAAEFWLARAAYPVAAQHARRLIALLEPLLESAQLAERAKAVRARLEGIVGPAPV